MYYGDNSTYWPDHKSWQHPVVWPDPSWPITYGRLSTPAGRKVWYNVGTLCVYLMLGTRPNIAFAVTHLLHHATNPSQDHLNKALYTCWYLIGMSTYSLVYNGGPGLIACTDSDWGSDPTSRLSQTGFYLKLADGLISWTSHAQKTIAYSSTEAEYMALSDCTVETVLSLGV